MAHKASAEAIKGARVYLGILVSTSIVFFLPAIIWIFSVVGTLDFTHGGIIRNDFTPLSTMYLLILFAFGIGKAQYFQFIHGYPRRWLLLPQLVRYSMLLLW